MRLFDDELSSLELEVLMDRVEFGSVEFLPQHNGVRFFITGKKGVPRLEYGDVVIVSKEPESIEQLRKRVLPVTYHLLSNIPGVLESYSNLNSLRSKTYLGYKLKALVVMRDSGVFDVRVLGVVLENKDSGNKVFEYFARDFGLKSPKTGVWFKVTRTFVGRRSASLVSDYTIVLGSIVRDIPDPHQSFNRKLLSVLSKFNLRLVEPEYTFSRQLMRFIEYLNMSFRSGDDVLKMVDDSVSVLVRPNGVMEVHGAQGGILFSNYLEKGKDVYPVNYPVTMLNWLKLFTYYLLTEEGMYKFNSYPPVEKAFM